MIRAGMLHSGRKGILNMSIPSFRLYLEREYGLAPDTKLAPGP